MKRREYETTDIADILGNLFVKKISMRNYVEVDLINQIQSFSQIIIKQAEKRALPQILYTNTLNSC